MTTSATPSPRLTRTRVVLAGGVAVAVLTAFAIGRLMADDDRPARRPVQAEARAEQAADLASTGAATAPRRAAPAAVVVTELPPGTLPVAPPPPPQELVTRVTREVETQLQALRPELTAQCFPSSGLPGGRSSARLTYNISFDASGREVARGISEERRAPAGALASCLRRLPLGALKIQPPGTGVGVAVAMVFP